MRTIMKLLENLVGSGSGVADLSLPATNQLAWWYGGSGGGVEATVTTTGDGQAATAWADKSANAVNLTKAGAGTLTYRKAVAALNNRGAVEGDGAAYLVATIANGLAADQNVYNIFIVFASSTTQDGVFYGEGSTAGNNPIAIPRLNESSAGRVSHTHRDDAATAFSGGGGTGANDGAAHLLTIRRIASNSFSIRKDGTQVATGANAPGATTVDRVALFALVRAAISLFYIGQIATTSIYSADNFATIEPLLATHYGITLP